MAILLDEVRVLMAYMTEGKNFNLTIPNLDDPLLKIPGDINDALYSKVKCVTIADLTSRQVGGAGTFDAIMESTHNHLKAEYESGRITGAEYTNAYIQLTQAALGSAVQFTLQKDQAYWQAQQAQIAAISARVQLEALKVQLVKAQYEAMLVEVQYVTAKVNLGTAKLQFDTTDYNLTNILPMQKIMVREQGNAAMAQTHDFRDDGIQVTGVLGRQKELYARQIISYQRDSEVKVAKLFTDAWTVMKTMDEGLAPPGSFTNAVLDTVLTNLRNQVNLSQ